MKSVVKTLSTAFLLCACFVLVFPAQARAFSEQDLDTIRLTNNCSQCNLSGANLSWSDFSGANLQRTSLSGANLHRTDLSGANLSRANLRNANLSRADLSGANLSDASLDGADLTWAIWTDGRMCIQDSIGECR